MKIRWLEDAVFDLEALRHYIAQDKITAANQVVKKVLAAVELLSEQPHLGRQGRVHNTRELIISATPYIVPYRVKDSTIEVLRVFHCAMQWPEII